MLEQDIELARLLVTKLEALEQRAQELHTDMHQAKGELDAAEATRSERAAYLDVLSRAAELLERQDLAVSSPETTELEGRVAAFQGQLDQIDQEASTFRELMNNLAQKAPHLLAAARGEEIEEHVAAQAEPANSAAANPEVSTQPEGFAYEPNPAPERAEIAEPAVSYAADDPLAILGRFNVNNLKTKEVFTYGRGVAYIVDTHSILERVPAYDRYLRHMEENQIRDELVRDFDTLKRELSGTVFLVFSSWYQTQQEFGNDVSLEFATGEDEGTGSAARRKVEELAGRLSAGERNVCVITGDSDLGEAMKNSGAYVLSLAEVFLA